jgi:hypothetical protein
MISDEITLNSGHLTKSNSNRLNKFEIDHLGLYNYSRKFCQYCVLTRVYSNFRSIANRTRISLLSGEKRFMERTVHMKCNKKLIDDSSWDMEVVHP